MKYLSTRATPDTEPRSFTSILLEGLASGGGLYMPITYPKITRAELEGWRALSYADLATQILVKYCDDIPVDDLNALTHAAYTGQTFCHARDPLRAAQITPLTLLGIEHEAPLYLLELSNGPTLAFKDIAMQLLGHLFEYALTRAGITLNILGATSGDTGSAAEYALRGKRGVCVFMLSPHQKMSAFQRAQMYSLQDANIFNLAVTGVFDECQDLVKAVLNDAAFKAQYKIGAVNSINWARLAAQVVYYFKAWFAATEAQGPFMPDTILPKVSFCVPSGNFGNICAGHIARMMGLPIDKLVVATNENDVLDEFFRTGVYRARTAAQTVETSSPSMDISKASNFERFIFDALGRDTAQVRQLFDQIETQGCFDLSKRDAFARIADEFGFVSGCSMHVERMATIRDTDARYGLTIDPHTANGLSVARRYLSAGVPMIVLETAQAVKFDAAIQEALGRTVVRPSVFYGIEHLPMRVEVIPADAGQVKTFIAAHAASDAAQR